MFSRGSYAENLRKKTVGGLVLIVGAVLAIIWANSPASGAYFALRDFHVGFEIAGIDLNLSLGHWASDGLPAAFFFLVALELKKEFVADDLLDFKRAVIPVATTFGAVTVPALIFVAINFTSGVEPLKG